MPTLRVGVDRGSYLFVTGSALLGAGAVCVYAAIHPAMGPVIVAGMLVVLGGANFALMTANRLQLEDDILVYKPVFGREVRMPVKTSKFRVFRMGILPSNADRARSIFATSNNGSFHAVRIAAGIFRRDDIADLLSRLRSLGADVADSD